MPTASKKPFDLPMSWNSLVSPWTLLTCRPISLKISLTKHGQCYFVNAKRVCHLRTSSFLLGPFSLPVGSFPWVRPSCNALSTYTGLSQPKRIIFLHDNFLKDLSMWYLFLDHWNGISLFLPPYTETSPDTPLYTDATGEQVMEPFVIIRSLKANGFLPTSSVPSQRLA